MKRTFGDQIKEYLFIKKKEKDAPDNTSIKLMHGMNRISIYMAIIAFGIIIYRILSK